ncbi:MAG TPA: hypothetical protein VK018_01540, partial [Porticoccaceae bacterium]|nr:hypothetical protein [Porticoccaceae bacterium]
PARHWTVIEQGAASPPSNRRPATEAKLKYQPLVFEFIDFLFLKSSKFGLRRENRAAILALWLKIH